LHLTIKDYGEDFSEDYCYIKFEHDISNEDYKRKLIIIELCYEIKFYLVYYNLFLDIILEKEYKHPKNVTLIIKYDENYEIEY